MGDVTIIETEDHEEPSGEQQSEQSEESGFYDRLNQLSGRIDTIEGRLSELNDAINAGTYAIAAHEHPEYASTSHEHPEYVKPSEIIVNEPTTEPAEPTERDPDREPSPTHPWFKRLGS